MMSGCKVQSSFTALGGPTDHRSMSDLDEMHAMCTKKPANTEKHAKNSENNLS